MNTIASNTLKHWEDDREIKIETSDTSTTLWFDTWGWKNSKITNDEVDEELLSIIWPDKDVRTYEKENPKSIVDKWSRYQAKWWEIISIDWVPHRVRYWRRSDELYADPETRYEPI